MTCSDITLPGRSERILEELLRDGEVSVDRLAQSFSVSRSTIRRNFSELEELGLVRRNRGGAIPSVTLLTNAVNVAMELSHLPEINVCMTGGFLSGGWFAWSAIWHSAPLVKYSLIRRSSDWTGFIRTWD